MNQGLEHIAKLAGVSKSTVSHVINNKPNVSERTRQRVLEIIREINYRPNQAARALVTQQTRVLSIVIPQALAATFVDPYFPALIQSITLTANQRNYAIMLWIGNSAEEEDRYRDRILNHGFFDGLIVASAVDGDPLLASLVEANLPYVLIGPPPPLIKYYVDIDNRSGACEGVTHLLKLGRQRVGIITGPMNMGAARARHQGYVDALQKAGLRLDERLVVIGNYDETSGYNAMKILLERGVDAVFCSSDMMALGALRAVSEVGRCIPDDIAVVGFDDMPFAATTNPPLTSMHQPIRELGRQAVEILTSLIEGVPHPTTQIILKAHLVIRSTCGAAKSV